MSKTFPTFDGKFDCRLEARFAIKSGKCVFKVGNTVVSQNIDIGGYGGGLKEYFPQIKRKSCFPHFIRFPTSSHKL